MIRSNQTIVTKVTTFDADKSAQEERLKRLKFLLDQTSTYANFLAEKIKQSQAEETCSNTKNRKTQRPKAKAETGSFVQPTLLSGGKLRNYQLEGVAWLVSLFENGMNGILADEMGLGKTIQCIGLIAHLWDHGVRGPFLIVAPLSTISNWVKEMGLWAPKFPALLYHGDPERRAELRQKHLNKNFDLPVIVTSYEIAMRDRRHLQSTHWKFLIVDEGHRLKNLDCKLIRDLKQLPSENRLLLTGTPLQNNLAELWSLLNFLLPDIFDDLQSFQSWFDFDQSDDGGGIKADLLLGQEAQQALLNSLHNILKPFLLRRLKTDVEVELPPKKEFLLYAPMASKQQELYEAILSGRIREIVGVSVSDEPVKPGQKRKRQKVQSYAEQSSNDEFEEMDHFDRFDDSEESFSEKDDYRKFAGSLSSSLQNKLMQLRKACNHPFLFYSPEPATGPKYAKMLVEASGKFQLLDRLLPALLTQGHRILIFSQMTRMLDLLEDFLDFRQIGHLRIDGSVPQEDREERIELFNSANDNNNNRSKGPKVPPVFLLSTRAGGLGINLVSADTVVFYDSDWNPQMDLQAMDRVHRIGQTRPVLVYRLTTDNSIERRILERAQSKRVLEKLVIYKSKIL